MTIIILYTKFRIGLETRHHATPASRFVVKHTTEDALVCDVASRVNEAMTIQLRVHSTVNIVYLLSCRLTPVVLQMIRFFWHRALDMSVRSIEIMRVRFMSFQLLYFGIPVYLLQLTKGSVTVFFFWPETIFTTITLLP